MSEILYLHMKLINIYSHVIESAQEAASDTPEKPPDAESEKMKSGDLHHSQVTALLWTFWAPT